MIKNWLSPIVWLSNNFLSLVGVVLVTTAAVLWIVLLPAMLHGEAASPYLGILIFLILPGIFFGGLALVPLGILLRVRARRKKGLAPPEFPPLNWRNTEFRRLLIFVGVTTVANLIIGGQFTYRAVHYMETVSFCGQTCHVVMEPEFTAYQNSPHSRVACVSCHIGPGASWFVKSKLSGLWQVVSVTFDLYQRPIPTPVHDLRPARETCEQCHWPQKFGEDRIRVINHYAEDEQNTTSKSVLLMRIGGGRNPRGIHGVHLGPGVVIRYAHSDESRQTIPWVEYDDGKGNKYEYLGADAKPGVQNGLEIRVMDCMDCHNRPSHTFELPERAVDNTMATGQISPALPFVRKRAVELLRKEYSSHDDAAQRIQAAFNEVYKDYDGKPEVARAAEAVTAIYKRNIFPLMNVKWGSYPNNIGHTDFPGCFRCHDDAHTSPSGDRKINQDCNSCHAMLAMEESDPKILGELGLK